MGRLRFETGALVRSLSQTGVPQRGGGKVKSGRDRKGNRVTASQTSSDADEEHREADNEGEMMPPQNVKTSQGAADDVDVQNGSVKGEDSDSQKGRLPKPRGNRKRPVRSPSFHSRGGFDDVEGMTREQVIEEGLSMAGLGGDGSYSGDEAQEDYKKASEATPRSRRKNSNKPSDTRTQMSASDQRAQVPSILEEPEAVELFRQMKAKFGMQEHPWETLGDLEEEGASASAGVDAGGGAGGDDVESPEEGEEAEAQGDVEDGEGRNASRHQTSLFDFADAMFEDEDVDFDEDDNVEAEGDGDDDDTEMDYEGLLQFPNENGTDEEAEAIARAEAEAENNTIDEVWGEQSKLTGERRKEDTSNFEKLDSEVVDRLYDIYSMKPVRFTTTADEESSDVVKSFRVIQQYSESSSWQLPIAVRQEMYDLHVNDPETWPPERLSREYGVKRARVDAIIKLFNLRGTVRTDPMLEDAIRLLETARGFNDRDKFPPNLPEAQMQNSIHSSRVVRLRKNETESEAGETLAKEFEDYVAKRERGPHPPKEPLQEAETSRGMKFKFTRI